MLKLKLPGEEFLDERTSRFIRTKPVKVKLEHSLASMSKWESKWEVPFLRDTEKTNEQMLSYIAIMANDKLSTRDLQRLILDHSEEIKDYIDSSQTATTFNERTQGPPSREIITSEIIYYWMVSFQIPFECEHWHLKKLLALIRVCSLKNQQPKKMNKSELAARNRQLNAQRRARLGSKG